MIVARMSSEKGMGVFFMSILLSSVRLTPNIDINLRYALLLKVRIALYDVIKDKNIYSKLPGSSCQSVQKSIAKDQCARNERKKKFFGQVEVETEIGRRFLRLQRRLRLCVRTGVVISLNYFHDGSAEDLSEELHVVCCLGLVPQRRHGEDPAAALTRARLSVMI